MTDERPICQLCGGRIDGEVYHWTNDERLAMHRNTTQCHDNDTFGMGMAGFLARNADYLMGDEEPVLRKAAPR